MRAPLRNLNVALLTTVMPTLMSAQNIVVNPGFEIGPNPGSWTSYGPGCIASVSWCVGTGSADVVGSFWTAAEGSRSVELAATVPGSLYQDLSTVAGQSYSLVFAFSGWPALGRTYDLEVLWGGTSVGVFTWIVSPTQSTTNMMWSDRSIASLIATGATTRLEFRDISDRGYNTAAAIDDIRVVATSAVVPEPASVALCAGGLTVLAGVSLRRRRVGAQTGQLFARGT